MVRYRDVMQGYTEEDYQYRGETKHLGLTIQPLVIYG